MIRGDAVEVEDATRRTRLASERTYLAWWRSGLTALAVGLAAGKLVPELSTGATWPFVVLGIGYSLLGLVFIVYGEHRRRVVDGAIARGEWAPLSARDAAAMTGAGVVLGAATILALLLTEI